jgi:hypothetical protein
MTQHILQGRTEAELLWFRRRGFLQAAAAWTAAGGFGAAHAQQRSNVVDLRGDALVNGQPLRRATMQTGDDIETGPGAATWCSSSATRRSRCARTRACVERGNTLNTVSVLRLLTGAVASVWGKRQPAQIVTPTLTAGIRGTGVYTEVFPSRARSYFCNCYGTVDMAAGVDRVTSRSDYHQSFWGEVSRAERPLLTPARAINHTDEELELLAALVGQQTAWEAIGRKGVKDGRATWRSSPPATHPAAPR